MKIISIVKLSAALVLAAPFFYLLSPTVSAEDPSDSEARYYYVGTIGDNLAIQMELIVESEDITGLYIYDKNGIPISLNGKLNRDNMTFTIVEQDEKGEKTGTFDGKLASDGAGFGTLSGEWTKANGLTSLGFKLKKVADFIFSTLRQGTLIEASFSVPYFLSPSQAFRDISDGLRKDMLSAQNKFVGEAQESFMTQSSAAGWQQSYDYRIEYYSADLLSLSGEVFSYSGGAHGNTYFASKNYWIKDGRAVQLKLSDLFLPNSKFIDTLSGLCINDLRKQKAGWVIGGEVRSFKEEELGVFALSPAGLVFAFAPYTVGSYAEGPYFVNVPFSELEGLIDPRGPLKQFVGQAQSEPDSAAP
ncbi:MAG: DUF3298 domain-containing protein [Deltaproteobacteria bacterium]